MGIPPTTGNPYPTIELVMNTARARVNDMLNDAAGDLLADDIPASQTYLSAAWRWYQAACATAGVETFIREIVLKGIPLRASNDPANKAWITWGGCSDGMNQFPQPVLPQDLIVPLSLWRRQSGTQSQFCLMTQAVDGLPTVFDCNVYDWREDGLYYYAASVAQDFQLRYSAYRQPLDITKPDTLVPMMMCEDCLGARVAFEFANARGSQQAPQLKAWADEALKTTITRSTRRRGRQSIRRIPYSRRNAGGSYWPVN